MEVYGRRKKKEKKKYLPDYAVGAAADGHDGGLVLGGDLEQIAEDVVLQEAVVVGQRDGEVRRRRRSYAVHLGLFDPEAAEELVADGEEAEE